MLEKDDTFRVGFAGADYGFFVKLGTGAIETVPSIAAAPAWLDAGQRAAWNDAWNYQPPQQLAQLRKERRLDADHVAVHEGATYLVRSINVRVSDTLTAIHVVKVLPDNSVVLVWHRLASWSPPAGIGPDLVANR
jgi:hypothetical protein